MKLRLKPEKPHDGIYREWTRQTNTTESKVPWCTRVAFRYDGPDAGVASLTETFRKVRCPACGRRLQLMTVDIEHGYGDFWPYIPPHKIRKLQARKLAARAKVKKKQKKASPARGK